MTLTLTDPSLLETRAYVNGVWTETGNTFPVTNPSSGAEIAQVTDVPVDMVNGAIDAAHAAQKDWAHWTGKERAAVLRKWYCLLYTSPSPRDS